MSRLTPPESNIIFLTAPVPAQDGERCRTISKSNRAFATRIGLWRVPSAAMVHRAKAASSWQATAWLSWWTSESRSVEHSSVYRRQCTHSVNQKRGNRHDIRPPRVHTTAPQRASAALQSEWPRASTPMAPAALVRRCSTVDARRPTMGGITPSFKLSKARLNRAYLAPQYARELRV